MSGLAGGAAVTDNRDPTDGVGDKAEELSWTLRCCAQIRVGAVSGRLWRGFGGKEATVSPQEMV